MKKQYLRISEVAELLSVTPQTVRKWRLQGKLKGYTTPGGQHVYSREEIESYLNKEKQTERPVHYARSSMGNKEAIAGQFKKLREVCGKPVMEIKDSGSGLNENRKGLERMIRLAKEKKITVIRVTEPDRLSRFGLKYLEELFGAYGVRIEYVFKDTEKSPEEELMADFMNLIASFSGKFYRMRGYREQKKLLKDAEGEIERREQKRENNNGHHGDTAAKER